MNTYLIGVVLKRELHKAGVALNKQDIDKIASEINDTALAKKAQIRARMSEKQKRIIGLAIDGYTNKEIAYKLGLSKSCVDEAVRYIRQKFHIKRKTDLWKIAT